MSIPSKKYPSEVRENHRLWHNSEGQWRGYNPWTPHPPRDSYRTNWEKAISFVDEHLTSMKEQLKELQAYASLYNQKACLEAKTPRQQSKI